VEFKKVRQVLNRAEKGNPSKVHVCFYAAPFGVTPIELDEVYPLSQHETTLPLDKETIDNVASQVAAYVMHTNYNSVILLNDPKNWNSTVQKSLKKTCIKKNVQFECVTVKAQARKDFSTRLENILKKNLSD
jgi:predicted RNA-binding protein